MPQQRDPAGDGETMIGDPPAQGSSAQPELFRFDNFAMPSSREVLAERILLTLLARDDGFVLADCAESMVSVSVGLADMLIAMLQEPVA